MYFESLEDSSTVGADYLLPSLIYICVQSNLVAPSATVQYLAALIPSTALQQSEERYYLTSFASTSSQTCQLSRGQQRHTLSSELVS